MDELTRYLKLGDYDKSKLEQILNTKIIITDDHIKHIKFDYYNYNPELNIIKLFEQYGYIFTNDIYILLINKNGYMLKYMSTDNITNEICKIAVQQTGNALEYVPENKKTNELCVIAIRQHMDTLEYVPANKKIAVVIYSMF